MVNLVVMLTIVTAGVFMFFNVIYLLNKDLTIINLNNSTISNCWRF